jgi:hypothetical protein
MLSKVCFEREVSRRAPEPFEGRRRAETLRRLSKSEKISEEIAQGVHRRQTYSKSQSSGGEAQVETQAFGLTRRRFKGRNL